jgi:hypothetical protein
MGGLRNPIERPLQLTVISGTGTPKPSFFGGSVAASMGFNTQLGTPVQPRALGSLDHPVNAREWYERAKAGIARFDLLLDRTAKIANKTERENILEWVGTAADTSSPAYRYASVVSDVKDDVEKFTPPNYGAYDVDRRQNRVDKLWDFNGEFKNKVENAENVFGILPAPTVISKERIVEIPGGIPTSTLLIGGAAVAGLAVLILILKPK